MQQHKECIENGLAVLGIELGSTRIKAVLINPQGDILSTGSFDWENRFENGIWTYSEQDIWQGLQGAYRDLTHQIEQTYQLKLTRLAAIGISAMMHGYLPFNQQDKLLTPFRTWRNNTTQTAAHQLSQHFNFNIPQRWSIAHLYQAILNKESHVSKIDFITTLAGYIHWQLTDQKVLGIGDASGMFPIDSSQQNYDQRMLSQFEQLAQLQGYSWKLSQILPKVLSAGENAGKLTDKGAKLLDPDGNLQPNIPFCPPEGDAGTGMVATNSIKAKTGNISAGTSAFAMLVLEKSLSRAYEQIDMVTTPEGKPVAMAHANNCSTDINAWVNLFKQNLQAFGVKVSDEQLYETLFTQALQAEPDCGKLLSYGFYSGEHSLGLNSGYPIFLHSADANFNLANFMQVHLYSAFAAMKLGVDILLQQEQVEIQQILGHGGIFKTKDIAQRILASALNIPIATIDTAGEGGAWGIALLANYLGKSQSLSEYLEQEIFANTQVHLVEPNQEISQGYQTFIKTYQKYIAVVQTAVEKMAKN